jgi:hypothetical protein
MRRQGFGAATRGLGGSGQATNGLPVSACPSL